MSLTNYLIEGLLPEQEKKKVVAVYGGGFKPPTSGHFEVVKQALKENPEIDEFIILIGGKPRNGITPDESILIWDIYKQYLPFKVEVKYTSVPPIKGIYNYAKEHPDEEVLFIIGAREGNEEDFKDIASRTTTLDKYPNLNLRTIVTQGGVSGTAARNTSKISLEKFKPFVPSELSDEEVEQVYNIVADKIQEVLTENASYSKEINIKEKIAQLTSHMVDKGMNIEPLPSLEFVDGDSENAKDFFGKTAYYDPNTQTIVLYTEGRHPKDILRSYSHEMVHHTQYLEDRLGDIAGTDTTSDDHLDTIEKEANLIGTMTFRNWTDSILNEAIVNEEIDLDKYVEDWLGRGGVHDSSSINRVFVLKLKQLGYEDFGTIYRILFIKNATKILDLREYIWANYNGKNISFSKTLEGAKNFMGQLIDQDLLKKGETFVIIKQKSNYYDLSGWVENKIKEAGGPWGFATVKDHWTGGLYRETQKTQEVLSTLNNNFEIEGRYSKRGKSLNEAIVGEKIECDNCGWDWNIVDGGDDLFICHECGHDNESLDEVKSYKHKHGFNDKLGKDPFGLNQFAREIAEEVISEGRYDKLANKLSSIAFEAFKNIHDRGDKKGEFEFSIGPFEEDIYSDQFEFDFEGYVEITDNEYIVDGGANQGFDTKGDEVTPLINLNFKIPKNPTTNPSWEDISFDIKDVVRHELEHLTQGGLNLKGGAGDEDPKLRRPSKQMADDQLIRDLIDADMLPKSRYYKLEKEVDAMLQGLYFKAKKSKRPFKDVIDDYLNIFINQKTISLEDKENILDIWRSRGKALSLPIFENQKQDMDYKIYSDMDGVLVDFEKGYEKLTGIDLKGEYRPDGEDFWKPIEQAGVGYWAGLEWMSDGKQLWSYLKPFNPVLLSAPSRSQSSRIGKHVWVKHKIPGTKLILRYASQKQQLATPESVLIDDRQANIDQWEAAGGIGILHTSTDNTIKQLKQLGL